MFKEPEAEKDPSNDVIFILKTVMDMSSMSYNKQTFKNMLFFGKMSGNISFAEWQTALQETTFIHIFLSELILNWIIQGFSSLIQSLCSCGLSLFMTSNKDVDC